MTKITKGHCLCGAVKLEGVGQPKISVCHCAQCRQWTGGTSINVTFDKGTSIVEDATLAWYESSDWAERGFCARCGSCIAYRLKADPLTLYPQAGIFDIPAGETIHEHIFIDSKPDYYDFADDSPRLTAEETLAKFQSEGI